MPMRYQYEFNAADKEERIERARSIVESSKDFTTHEEWKRASSEMADLMEEWRIMDQNADGARTRYRNYDENEALWELFFNERSYFYNGRDAWYKARKRGNRKRGEAEPPALAEPSPVTREAAPVVFAEEPSPVRSEESWYPIDIADTATREYNKRIRESIARKAAIDTAVNASHEASQIAQQSSERRPWTPPDPAEAVRMRAAFEQKSQEALERYKRWQLESEERHRKLRGD